jgi:hypothetical protein
MEPFLYRKEDDNDFKILDAFVNEITNELLDKHPESRDDFGQERKNEVW